MFDDNSSIKLRIRNLLIVMLIVSAAIIITITQKPKHTVAHSNILEIPVREVQEEQLVPIIGELIQDDTLELSTEIEIFSSNEEVSTLDKDNTISDTEQEVAYSGIIQREGSVSDSLLFSIEYYYCLIPSSIRTSLENKGWQYICSSEDFTGRYGTSHKVLAMTAYDDKIIYIDARDSAKDAIIHEVGHAFDTTQGMLSSSSEFNEIYEEERNNFCNVWSTNVNNTNTLSEYFAEAFQAIIENPPLIQTNCPRTYTYITSCIDSI